MERVTIFKAARDIVRKETVSVSIKQFNDFVRKSGSESTVRVEKAKNRKK
jgi:hypothetical protein